MSFSEPIDWSQSQLADINPRVQSGAPVLRGTRIPISAIIDNFAYGMTAAEISEQFQVPPDRIEAILAYSKSR